MANKYKKRCSIPVVIRKMQIQTNYDKIPLNTNWMAIIKKMDNS